jgi:hypothetical protein
MKKLTTLTLGILLTVNLFSQDMSEIFQTEKATWFGLDYSEAYLIGSEGFTNPSDIKDRYFNSWNLLIKNEYDKYNIGKFFKKSKVEISLENVTTRNQDLNIYDRVVDDNSKMLHLDKDKVQEMINKYEFSDDQEGLGIVFVVESYSKTAVIANYYVTLFDIKTKKVLLTERMEGKPGGFGIRNYWAKSYYNVLNTIYKKRYKAWEKQYK